jgi:mannosyltransferase PIG-V
MKRLILVYLAVRLVLLALTLLSGRLPYAEGARWLDERDDGLRYRFADHRLLDAHVRWDGKAYLHIASLGYDNARERRSNTAFFAGYPWMVRGLHAAVMRPLLGAERAAKPEAWIVAGLLVNTASFLGALALLRAWVRRRYGNTELADRAALLLILGPASFVFHATHSESSFLLFALLAFLAVEKGQMVGGLIATAAASAVRLFGLTLMAPLGLLALERVDWRPWRLGPSLLLFALPPLGALLVLLRMAEVNGHLDAYFHQQRHFFGHETVPDWGSVLYLFRLERKETWFIVRDYYQVFHGLLAFAGAIWLWRRDSNHKLPGCLAYLTTTLLLVGIPLLSGEVISMPRYVSVAFPLYAAAAMLIGRGRRAQILLGVSFLLQIAAWIGWMQGCPLVV